MFRLFGCLWPPVFGQVVHSYSATVAQLLAALDKSPGCGRAEGPTDAGKCLIGGVCSPFSSRTRVIRPMPAVWPTPSGSVRLSP